MNGDGGGTRRLAAALVLAVAVTVGGGTVLSRWAQEGARPETVGAVDQPAGRAAGTAGTAATTTTAPPPVAASVPTGYEPFPATTALPPTPIPGTPPTTTATSPARVPEATTTSTSAPRPAADGPPGPACTSTMFDTRLALERTTYRVGETVRGTATFTNVSGNTCWWASSTGRTEVLDAGGRPVTAFPAVIRDGFHWIPFTNGEVFTHIPTWDQQACPPEGHPAPCGQVPPGSYTMVVTEQPYGVARASFQVVAG